MATRFKLGMFDPPDQVPYAATTMSVVGSKKHRDLAYRAALQSMVLLKNRNQDATLGMHRPGDDPVCARSAVARQARAEG